MNYTPASTTQRGVSWSIISGSQYATINPISGHLVATEDADESTVIVRATSTENPLIYGEATLLVSAAGRVTYFDWIKSDDHAYIVVPGFQQFGGKITAEFTYGDIGNTYPWASLNSQTQDFQRLGAYRRGDGKAGILLGSQFLSLYGDNVVATDIYRMEYEPSASESVNCTSSIYINDIFWKNKGEVKAWLNGDFIFLALGSNTAGPGTPITGINNYSNGKFRYFKVEDGDGNVLVELRPAKDPDGNPALYDKANGIYYYNSNSVGTLSVGNDE